MEFFENLAVHFSSATNEWSTPQDFYDRLDAEFGFTLDPCATEDNAKCEKYFTEADNGLEQDWTGHVVFMNPPYGREIGNWVAKAYRESQKGALVVCLIPARTDTAYWHDYAAKGDVRFVRGRLRFGGSKWNAPFPSAVVVFWPPAMVGAERHSRTTTDSEAKTPRSPAKEGEQVDELD